MRTASITFSVTHDFPLLVCQDECWTWSKLGFWMSYWKYQTV